MAAFSWIFSVKNILQKLAYYRYNRSLRMNVLFHVKLLYFVVKKAIITSPVFQYWHPTL